MTWRTFAETIVAAKLTDDRPWKIILCLFRAAGVKENDEPLEKTIRSWLENRRHCKASCYFPAGKINYKEVFRFFRKAPEGKLRNLKKEFQMNLDANSPIDVSTDNLDTFCWSLVNQFLDLLGLQRIDFSENPLLLAEESIKNIHPYDKCCLYCKHWKGDKSIVWPGRIPTTGTCSAQRVNKNNIVTRLRRRLSSDAVCNQYQADQDLMDNLKQIGYRVKE